jgi:myosin-5
MSSSYTKGTQVWFPDPVEGWVPATTTSITLPSDDNPASLVEMNISIDRDTSSDDSGTSKALKFPLSVLKAAEAGGINLGVATAVPGQDTLPPLRNPPLLESSEDLASLSNLNEPSGEFDTACFIVRSSAGELTQSVLHAIRTRYDMHYPYTYSGIVLVRVLFLRHRTNDCGAAMLIARSQ